MIINIQFTAIDGGVEFEHEFSKSILDTDDPFEEGFNYASEWCEGRCLDVANVSVSILDDSTGEYKGTVTYPGQWKEMKKAK